MTGNTDISLPLLETWQRNRLFPKVRIHATGSFAYILTFIIKYYLADKNQTI